MKIIEAAREILVKTKTELYLAMRVNAELTPKEYRNHFGDLGELINTIDQIQNLDELTTYLSDDGQDLDDYVDLLEKAIRMVEEG